MIRAVVFDLDGLLLDSEVYWERARREFCAGLGCDWTPQDELGVKGYNSPEWADRIHERCGTDMQRAEIIAAVEARMESLYADHLPVLPCAERTVQALAAHFPLAVASSSPPGLIQYAVRAAGIAHCFAVLVSADTVGRGKPAPDVFLEAATRLQVLPHETAIFEDSSAGLGAARAANAFVIAVPNPHYPPGDDALARADLVLGSLCEFRPEMLPATP